MQSLLDTHLLLWSVFEPDTLSRKARRLLNAPASSYAFSVVSLWEIAVKRALRRTDFKHDPADLRHELLRQGLHELQVTAHHALAVERLPMLHRDPFDRLLIAQAHTEGMRLLTADRLIALYPGVESV